MEDPPCDQTICSASEIEDRQLSMIKPIPSMILMNISVETIDDFFQDMTKEQYGVKVLINVLDDDSCEDPRLHEICKSLFEENKVIMEEACSMPR